MPDKINRVDFRWYIMRTQPRQERKLASLLDQYKEKANNILEVYAPTHTTVSVRHGMDEHQVPLFSGFVFTLATQGALRDFMERYALGDILQYERKRSDGEKARLRVIPEEQMRAFRDYNENYADKVVVLERPFTDYAFNTKDNKPNEIVRVIDGPLAGCEGYICRFRRERRLVFQVRGVEKGSFLTVSYPNVWDLHVIRLHHEAGDTLPDGIQKERAVDLLVGMLQAAGYGESTPTKLLDLIDYLTSKPSFTQLSLSLLKKGEEALANRLASMTNEEAESLLNLVRYEKDNPGYVRHHWQSLSLRPFLTPTAGKVIPADDEETSLPHADFTEYIRRVDITERVYYPNKNESEPVTTTYYAHVGVKEHKVNGTYIVFANWDAFLGEYFRTFGNANRKLVSGIHADDKLAASFHNYAPTLYAILTDDDSEVKAIRAFPVGNTKLHVMAMVATDIEAAKRTLTDTCVKVCQELHTTTHLAMWRRFLRTVWLHR